MGVNQVSVEEKDATGLVIEGGKLMNATILKKIAATVGMLVLFSSVAYSKDKPTEINANPTLAEATAFAESIEKKSRCDGDVFMGGKGIYVSTPLCRLETSAMRARERYEDFVVTEEVLAEHRPGFLSVLSFPFVSADKINVVPAAEVLVLRSTDEKVVVKPAETETLEAEEFSNKMGYKESFPSFIAWFTVEDWKRVQNQKGEWEVVCLRPDVGEYSLKFKAKNFK